MAVQLDQNGKDDLKTQFVTREGTYRLMTLSEYSRPNRVGYQTNQNNPQVRVSLVSLPPYMGPAATTSATASTTLGQVQQQQQTSTATTSTQQQQQQQNQSTASTTVSLQPTQSTSASSALLGGAPILNGLTDGVSDLSSGAAIAASGGDRICFNFGKELYVYAYRGCKKLTADLSKPIDKKLYKGTNPSCHDFNETAAQCDGAPLLVGFTTGQIQLVQPGKREPGRLFNEERLIDKTKVTCLKWLPKSSNLFLASHTSGALYVYNEELPCTPTAPSYQSFKTGEGYTVLTCKSKTTRNPLYKWTFSTENWSINEFCFSPCGQMLAIVSQDGFLRVFNYDKMELIGVARSYFGGFLCVCWSPDGKYIVVGGEDDLVTIWSVHERRVVARGQGHRSWVSVVAFDPYNTSCSNWDGPDFSDDENTMADGYFCYGGDNQNDGDCDGNTLGVKRPTSHRDSSIMSEKLGTSYRLGSVSQDTQLCLWDITEDTLRQSHEIRQRLSSYDPQVVNGDVSVVNSVESQQQQQQNQQQQQQQQHQSGSNDAKVINPIASCSLNSSGTKDTIEGSGSNSSKNSSNSSSKSGSKFATANCTSGSDSNRSSVVELNHSKQFNTSCNSSAKTSTHFVNSVSTPSDTSKSSSSSKTLSTSDSGLTAFNTFTQRFSNFGFGSGEKKSAGTSSTSDATTSNHHHKKSFTFSKSAAANHHVGSFLHSNNANDKSSNDTLTMASSLKNSKSVVPSYDPMKLIGTGVCPRYDQCPLLEPLVCKKIAHERLTALIFREDCFLTACQDGFIYTWARPGHSNISQHISASPSAPPGGGTVV